MTDQTPERGSEPHHKTKTIYRVDASRSRAGAREAQAPDPRRAPRKRTATRGRIAAAGIGVAAMTGLVANMEVTAGHAQAASKIPTGGVVAQHAAKNPHQAAVLGNIAVAKANEPIVLTPHAVVNTVSASPSGGGGSYSGGSYSAAPAAAAPVASSGGSRP
jgi:hypothetical protein